MRSSINWSSNKYKVTSQVCVPSINQINMPETTKAKTRYYLQHSLDRECVPRFELKYSSWGNGQRLNHWRVQVRLFRAIKAYWCTQDSDCLGWKCTEKKTSLKTNLIFHSVTPHCVMGIMLDLNREHPLFQDTCCSTEKPRSVVVSD